MNQSSKTIFKTSLFKFQKENNWNVIYMDFGDIHYARAKMQHHGCILTKVWKSAKSLTSWWIISDVYYNMMHWKKSNCIVWSLSYRTKQYADSVLRDIYPFPSRIRILNAAVATHAIDIHWNLRHVRWVEIWGNVWSGTHLGT